MQRSYGSQRSYILFMFSFSAITLFLSFALIFFSSLSLILLCSCTERWEKISSYHLLCSSRIWVRLFFIFYFFAEAGSDFISLIISSSTTSHKGISNKYFLPFVVGLFFRTDWYSLIYYIPSASLPCKLHSLGTSWPFLLSFTRNHYWGVGLLLK